MSYPAYGSPADDRRPEPQGQPLVPSADLPPRPPSPGGRVGRAYGVGLREESRHGGNNTSSSVTVLEFRLAEPGNPQPLDVLMRGRSLSGTVRDGDWIELAGPPDAMNRWNVAKVQNLTTGSTVLAVGGRPNKVVTIVAVAVMAAMVLFFVLVVVGVMASA